MFKLDGDRNRKFTRPKKESRPKIESRRKMRRFQTGLKEGPWSPEEDEKLISFIQKHGHKDWRPIPKLVGLKRCGNSCKSRWWNHLLPDIKRAKISEREEQTVLNSNSKERKFSQDEGEIILETLTGNDEIENFNSGEEKMDLSHLPIEGEPQGMTSTESAVVSDNLMDFTSEFTDGKTFESRNTLKEWVQTVGRKNGFAIVTNRSDSGRITFGCERSGQYRNTREDAQNKKETQLRNINTKKCGCPFELQYQRDNGDNWKLKAVCGVHNHVITKPLNGRSYLGRLSEKETLLAIEMRERNVCSKDILKELQKRDVNNVSTEKDIYNVVQRDKVKKMDKSSSNTHNSNISVSSFPVWLQQYIHDVKNVAADGHCGFRAIAGLMDFGENDWMRVRKDLLNELNSNLEDYKLLYGSQEIVEELKNALSYWKNRPAGCDKWMTMPNMGHLIASTYTVVLFFLSSPESLTFLPLRSPHMPLDSRKHIAIGLVNNHFVGVFLVPDHPIPPIANKWKEFCHPCAKGWDTIYNPQIQLFQKIMGRDVDTTAVIYIDSDSPTVELPDMTDLIQKLVPVKNSGVEGIGNDVVEIKRPYQDHGLMTHLIRELWPFQDQDVVGPLLHYNQLREQGTISGVEGIGNDVVEIKQLYQDHGLMTDLIRELWPFQDQGVVGPSPHYRQLRKQGVISGVEGIENDVVEIKRPYQDHGLMTDLIRKLVPVENSGVEEIENDVVEIKRPYQDHDLITDLIRDFFLSR